VIVVTRAIDAQWLKFTREISGGHLVLTKAGKIVLSTLPADRNGQSFEPDNNQLMVDGEPYLARLVTTGEAPNLPQLWFAQSQQELTAPLRAQRDRMLALVILGCVGGLVAGFMILRNFSAPLGNLMNMMQEVSAGRLPDFKRGPARDEIGYLSNRFAEMVTSLREQQEEVRRAHVQLERDAVTDALTGFYNRRYLYDLFPKLWAEAMRSGKPLALIMVDLDLFKRINDRYGHLVGDLVLLHAASVLREACRVSDFLFRLGGEEFLILAPGDLEGAQILAEKIRSQLEREMCKEGGRVIPVTASFGVAQAEAGDGVNSLNQTLARADQALYSAKQGGRNRVAVWYPHRQTA
jgi:diguanylate cyclase (GGDEF)-like protein